MDFMFYDPLTDLLRVQRQLAQIQTELCHHECSCEAAQKARKLEEERKKGEEEKEEEECCKCKDKKAEEGKEEEVSKALTEGKKKEEAKDNEGELDLWWPAKEMWWPAVDLKETEAGYELHAELPGVKKEDVSIELRGQGPNKRLVVSGKKASEEKKEGEKWHRVERVFGNFERAFTVPADTMPADIKANFENGMLHVAFPKPQPVEPVKIEIQ